MKLRLPPSALARAAWLCALPLLHGCFSGLLSHEPAPQAYLLSLPPPPSGAVASGAAKPAAVPMRGPSDSETLQVLTPLIAPGLEGDGIAVLRSGQRLDYYNGARWAASAPSMLQMLIIEALRRQGRFSLVEPDNGPFSTEYQLGLTLSHFEADEDGTGAATVRVALVCTFGRRDTRGTVESFTAESEVRADAERMGAVIAAFEQATDAAIAQLVAHVASQGATSDAATP